MKYLICVIVAFFIFCGIASAHQPRIIDSNFITVNAPESSQAFYEELKGEPVIFKINSLKPFNLYANILAPYILDARTDFDFEITRNGAQVAFFRGQDFDWTIFYEEFVGDMYLKGPEFSQTAEAGNYIIKVYNNNNNQGKFVMAIGDKEEFPLSEIILAVKNLPKIKKDFFGKSIFSIFASKIGFYISVLIGIIGILTIVGVFVLRSRY